MAAPSITSQRWSIENRRTRSSTVRASVVVPGLALGELGLHKERALLREPLPRREALGDLDPRAPDVSHSHGSHREAIAVDHEDDRPPLDGLEGPPRDDD